MSAQDTIATPGTLAAALVAREVDHERIAAACGVSRSLPHDQRTAAIIDNFRAWASTCSEWARRAIDARVRLEEADEALRGAIVTRDAWRDTAVAAAAGLARVAAALGIGPASEQPADAPRVAAACVAAAEALTDRPAADTSEIVRLTRSRDGWCSDAIRCAEAIGAIADAIHLAPGQVSTNPVDGPTVAGHILDALALRDTLYEAARNDLCATRAHHAHASEANAKLRAEVDAATRRADAALVALADVAEALDAHPSCDAGNADALAAACLARIERDHSAVQRFVDEAAATRAHLNAAREANAAAMAQLATLARAAR